MFSHEWLATNWSKTESLKKKKAKNSEARDPWIGVQATIKRLEYNKGKKRDLLGERKGPIFKYFNL